MSPVLHCFRRIAVPACLLVLGCAGDPTGPLGSGLWGGTGIAFEVFADSTRVEFDCAHGFVHGPIHVLEGRFREAGGFVLEHGGPIREDEEPDLRAAIYSGTVSGGTLALTVQVEGLAQELGPYGLRLGAAPVLRKCL